jgi:predicted dehydrogenase
VSLRLGIVGGGFITGFHLRALESVRGIELAGLTSRTPPTDLAESARRRGLGDTVVYDSVEEMIRHVDVVSICSPNFTRVEAVEAIAQAVDQGAELKALACEKPLARNLPEARRMIELADRIGVPTFFLENQVHLPAVQAARQQLGEVSERMGPLLLARAAEEHGGPHNSWFWDPRTQGGGVLSDMGCHSLAVSWYLLTPHDRPIDYLIPERVTARVGLLKWGQDRWKQHLRDEFGVDYDQAPAEDFATGTIEYRDPESGLRTMAQFTVSWMYDKQGLRLLVDGMGAGYALEVNSLRSPLEVFIGDVAAAGVADAELALEKSTASQGLLAVQPNEADLYGYIAELQDMVRTIDEGRRPLLDWSFGREIVRLTMASYMSSEEERTIDLTDPPTREALESYIPLIQQGRGGEVLG